MRTLKCNKCQDKTKHNMLSKVTIITKWRSIINVIYQCQKCLSIKTLKKEIKNDKVEIWD